MSGCVGGICTGGEMEIVNQFRCSVFDENGLTYLSCLFLSTRISRPTFVILASGPSNTSNGVYIASSFCFFSFF